MTPSLPQDSACQPTIADRTRGSAGPTGRKMFGSERHLIGTTNGAQLESLWCVLKGSGCDFDDCWVAVAEALGMKPDPAWDITDLLNAAGDVINAASWKTLRVIGTDVFFDLRGDSDVYPLEQWDRRTTEEATDDALFFDGDCYVCVRHPWVPADGHRELGGIVASGRKKWAEIDTILDTHRAAHPDEEYT